MKMWKFHSSGMQMIYAQYQLGNKKLIAFLKVHKRLILTSFLMGVIWIAIESSTSSWLTYTIPIYIFSTTPILILWRYVESDLKNLHSLIGFGNILYSRTSIFCSQIKISISTFFWNNQGIVSFPWLFIKRAILFEKFYAALTREFFFITRQTSLNPYLILDHYLLRIMMFQDCKMKRLLHSKLCSIDHFFIVAVCRLSSSSSLCSSSRRVFSLLLSNFFHSNGLSPKRSSRVRA